MITLERVGMDAVPWEELDRRADRSIFQTREWLQFIAATQRAEQVVAVIKDRGVVIGHFSGLIARRFGLRILGSPFRGWTTPRMGVNLEPGAVLGDVLEALPHFAFKQLRCNVLQLSERRYSSVDWTTSATSFCVRREQNLEIDLTQSEDRLFANMATAKRRGARKAARSGVIIEEAAAEGFAEDYFAQLQDVFAKTSNVPIYDVDRVRQLINHLHPTGRLLLLRARDAEGHSIATGIFPVFNDMIQFWGGASWRPYQHLHPNEYLMWHAITHGQARGMQVFDMGGWADYKLQYGGHPVTEITLAQSSPAILCEQRELAEGIYLKGRRLLGRIKHRIRQAKGASPLPASYREAGRERGTR